jgi:GTPase SAR1 family protein/gas vesicle protein
MSVERHFENRAWAFRALEDLETFQSDPDFEGNLEDEQRLLTRKRSELKEGKYRVVFLGAFNVGKSTLINAFLNDDCLPTVMEECTSKITHVVRGDSTRVVLKLSETATEGELDALRATIDRCRIPVSISKLDEPAEMVIDFQRDSSKELVLALRTLVTLAADDDFPQLKTLRDRFEELIIQVPNALLEEDLAYVDSPGTHTISETNTRITQEIIPDSHLVICMLDSQSAGTAQNREFIRSIVEHRHRKVFFVINKADQLNEEEIDPTGKHGPARDLVRSLDGIIKDPELFFTSSLYARAAGKLAKGEIDLDAIDANNKIKIPFSAYKGILESDEPEQEAANLLLEQSRFPALQRRVFEYLYKENREGAVLESICRFLDTQARRYSRPLEVKLDIAQTVPRLEELEADRRRVTDLINDNTRYRDEISAVFEKVGTEDDAEKAPYAKYLERTISTDIVEEEILKPLEQWTQDAVKFKEGKTGNFASVVTDADERVGALLTKASEGINESVTGVEDRVLVRMGQALGDYGKFERAPIAASTESIGTVSAGMGSSYFGFLAAGAALFGAVGAGIGANVGLPEQLQQVLDPATLAVPQIDAILGGAAGAIVGAISGLALRSTTSGDAQRDKLRKSLRAAVEKAIFGTAQENGATTESLQSRIAEQLASRHATMIAFIGNAFEKRTQELQRELDTIVAEADEIIRERDEIIANLEPKIEQLGELSTRAQEIVRENAPIEDVIDIRSEDESKEDDGEHKLKVI